MLVFRDGRRQVEGPALLSQFVGILKYLCGSGTICHEAILDALLRAGELECALADSASADLDRIASITDAIAENLVSGSSRLLVPEWRGLLSPSFSPYTVFIFPPEGFSYYT